MRRDLVYRDEIMDSLVKEYNRKRTNDGLKLAWIEKAVNDVKPAELATNLQPTCNTDLPDNNVGDMISRSSLLEKYDKEHEGPPGRARKLIEDEPPAKQGTTTMTVGRTKGETTMWYECGWCGEPVDQADNFCRNCGRRFQKDGIG